MQRFIIKNTDIKRNAQAAIQELDPDKAMEVEIKQPNRSRSQNALYWQWLTVLSNETGYTKDEMHTLMAGYFLGTETMTVDGQAITVAKSTRNLTVGQFSEYLEEIEAWALEHDVYLPHPSDYHFAVYGVKQ